MKKDIWEDFGRMTEDAILQDPELENVKGGWTIKDIHFPFNINHCIDNNCDPTNCGACAGNTTGGAPRTCPYSE